jgi:hypothetical protein
MVQHGYSKLSVSTNSTCYSMFDKHDISACGRTLTSRPFHARDKSQKAFAELPRRKSEKLAAPQRKAAGRTVCGWRGRVGGQRI